MRWVNWQATSYRSGSNVAEWNIHIAFNQMNLAYLQLAMLGMNDMVLNETQAMKFMQGGGKALDRKMGPENCIIIQGGVLACHDNLTKLLFSKIVEHGR